MANVDRIRRALLRGHPASHSPAPLTPPWAQRFDQFVDTCVRCDDCVRACPEGMLVRGEGGFPTLDFTAGSCTFCRACVEACAAGALSPSTVPVWSQVAYISRDCLTNEGVYCQSCRDACQVDAVTFCTAVGHVPQPRIDAARCTGCGACVSPCPSDAIEIRRLEGVP